MALKDYVGTFRYKTKNKKPSIATTQKWVYGGP